jgi:hypothetical protein
MILTDSLDELERLRNVNAWNRGTMSATSQSSGTRRDRCVFPRRQSYRLQEGWCINSTGQRQHQLAGQFVKEVLEVGTSATSTLKEQQNLRAKHKCACLELHADGDAYVSEDDGAYENDFDTCTPYSKYSSIDDQL